MCASLAARAYDGPRRGMPTRPSVGPSAHLSPGSALLLPGPVSRPPPVRLSVRSARPGYARLKVAVATPASYDSCVFAVGGNVGLFVCFGVCVCVFVCLRLVAAASVCFSVSDSVSFSLSCLWVYLSVCLCPSLSMLFPVISFFVLVSVSVSLSICQCVCLSVCVFVGLSICPSF